MNHPKRYLILNFARIRPLDAANNIKAIFELQGEMTQHDYLKELAFSVVSQRGYCWPIALKAVCWIFSGWN
jgi:hypothetical protein